MVTTTEIHYTPEAARPVVGNRVLHVLDVDGEEVRVFVSKKGGTVGYSIEVEAHDEAVAIAAISHVATNLMGKEGS